MHFPLNNSVCRSRQLSCPLIWLDNLDVVPSQLMGCIFHLTTPPCRVATICLLVHVVKSIFPLVSCHQYWTWHDLSDCGHFFEWHFWNFPLFSSMFTVCTTLLKVCKEVVVQHETNISEKKSPVQVHCPKKFMHIQWAGKKFPGMREQAYFPTVFINKFCIVLGEEGLPIKCTNIFLQKYF